MKVFEWIDEKGVGVVSGWKLQTAQRTRLEAKLDMLVRARGNVQLRPMVCLGPFEFTDWTILYPATEKQFELIPADAADKAEERRKVLLANPGRRRLLIDDED